MVHCAPTNDEAYDVAEESFEWYPKYGAHASSRSVAEWLEEKQTGARHLRVRGERAAARPRRQRSTTSPSTTSTTPAPASSAIPTECIETAKRYEAVGCDLLLCLVNPYKIPHDKVMQSIELIGKHVIPEFA